MVLTVERKGRRAALVLSDEGPPFGPPEQHFTREAQVDLKLRPGGRYERGAYCLPEKKVNALANSMRDEPARLIEHGQGTVSHRVADSHIAVTRN